MLQEELEFSISQYVDGTLVDDASRARVEELLASNVEAREAFHSFQKMDTVLRTAMPLPALDWAAVNASIVSVIDQADEADAAEDAARRSRLKIANRARWVGSFIAVAAAIAVVASLTMRQPKSKYAADHNGTISIAIGPGTGDNGTISIGDDTVAVVDPSANTTVNATTVAIGPSPEVASSNSFLDDELTGQSSSGRVIIAGEMSAPASGQTDAGAAPF